MSLVASFGQSSLPFVLLGLAALLLGLVGVAMRVSSAGHEGPGWDGSSYEVQFMLGTLLAMVFCPIGIAAFGYVWLWH